MHTADILKLLEVHDLHLLPLEALGERAELQHHPDTASTKWRLDHELIEHLDAISDIDVPAIDAVAAMRKLGRIDLVPSVYEWLAEEATLDQTRAFLVIEGGPDGGFDDLVAACQIGIDGEPKLELARSYWDEMGGGDPGRVRTELLAVMERRFRRGAAWSYGVDARASA